MPSRTRSSVYIFIAISAVVIACLLLVKNTLSPISDPVVSVTNAVASPEPVSSMHFEVVTDLVAQEKGLGGRSDIPHNYGMLFVFPKDGKQGFWMKDMLVPIDIIWLSDNGTVVGIEESVATSTYPNVFYAPQPVRYVLETHAGESLARDWSIGSVIDIPLQK